MGEIPTDGSPSDLYYLTTIDTRGRGKTSFPKPSQIWTGYKNQLTDLLNLHMPVLLSSEMLGVGSHFWADQRFETALAQL